jgi:Uma2 family endonuclease
MALPVPRHLFTVDEYYRMYEAGIFSQDDRVELIDGEIVEMSPIGSNHAACVLRLNALLNRLIGARAFVSVQSPVRLGKRTEPEPDIALLAPRDDYYASGHPEPADLLLIIEVADTSLSYDLDMKAPRYARAGIAEYWLVDLPGEAIEVYSEPGKSRYQQATRFERGETIASQTLPGLTLDVNAILG